MTFMRTIFSLYVSFPSFGPEMRSSCNGLS